MGIFETEEVFPWRFISAPMAELTHAGYRHWCELYGGADLYITEMIGARALIHENPYESWYTEVEPVPEKTIFQLWGAHENDFFEAARRLADKPVLGVDINMGCSAPQIRSKGGGIGLMSSPDKAARIVEGLRKILVGKSLSAKIRIGEKEDPVSLLSFAENLQNAGVDWLSLNPRVRKDKHRRPGRWEFVTLLKENLKIPVIGNSDISDWDSYRSRRTLSGSDGYMIGRASVLKPWLFSDLRQRELNGDKKDYLEHKNIDLKESVFMALSLIERWQPADFHVSRARRFLSIWCANLKFGNQFIKIISVSDSIQEMRNSLDDYFDRHPEEKIMKM